MPKESENLVLLNDLRHQLGYVPLNKEPENIAERITKLKAQIERGERIVINKSRLSPPSAVAKANEAGEPPATTTRQEKAVAKNKKADKAETQAKTEKQEDPPKEKETTTKKKTEKAAKAASPESTEAVKSVRLGDICKRTGIDTRLARIKLRTAYKDQKKSGAPDTIGDSWLWKQSDAAKIEAIIKGESK
jgi:G3E family GTPase